MGRLIEFLAQYSFDPWNNTLNEPRGMNETPHCGNIFYDKTVEEIILSPAELQRLTKPYPLQYVPTFNVFEGIRCELLKQA